MLKNNKLLWLKISNMKKKKKKSVHWSQHQSSVNLTTLTDQSTKVPANEPFPGKGAADHWKSAPKLVPHGSGENWPLRNEDRTLNL